MSLEEQITAYKEIGRKIEELEQEKKALSRAIMQQMQGKTVQVADYLVRRYVRLSIKVPLEKARSLGALKMEEVIDKDKLKWLYRQGQPIEGISEIAYIQISSTQPHFFEKTD